MYICGQATVPARAKSRRISSAEDFSCRASFFSCALRSVETYNFIASSSSRKTTRSAGSAKAIHSTIITFGWPIRRRYRSHILARLRLTTRIDRGSPNDCALRQLMNQPCFRPRIELRRWVGFLTDFAIIQMVALEYWLQVLPIGAIVFLNWSRFDFQSTDPSP